MPMFADPAEREVWAIAKRGVIAGDDGAVLSDWIDVQKTLCAWRRCFGPCKTLSIKMQINR